MENLILWGTSKQILNAIETTLSAERDKIKILGVHQTDSPVSVGPDYLYFSADDVLHTDCPVLVCGSRYDTALIQGIVSLGIARERLIPEGQFSVSQHVLFPLPGASWEKTLYPLQ